MKYIKIRNQYENSTKSCTFSPDTMKAYSYGWWLFVDRIGNKIVYNNYSYSNTTCKHQSNVLRLLGYKYDVSIEAPDGLQNLPSAISYYERKIQDLKEKIATPRTRKTTNQKRKEMIEFYYGKIDQVNDLMANKNNMYSPLGKALQGR